MVLFSLASYCFSTCLPLYEEGLYRRVDKFIYLFVILTIKIVARGRNLIYLLSIREKHILKELIDNKA